jgi:sulfite dehydrogenase (quinone) subunit SoeC
VHPALSVVFFTAISGSGYGLLLLLGLIIAVDPQALGRWHALVLLLAGGLLVSAGLVASVAHLGQPRRAWRALGQWRSSWLSREGVAALLAYLPLLGLALALLADAAPAWLRLGAVALIALAIATVYCTARIYTSLLPVPAWRHRLVLPGYLGFALLGGLLWLGALSALAGQPPTPTLAASVALLALAMAGLKWRYWRAIDRAVLPVTLAAATGLAGATGMRVLEAPHTEANYLLREMGFVLARRHGDRLRRLALGLLLASALMAVAMTLPNAWLQASAALVALLAGQFAILIERWLLFAQARHLVTVYYGAGSAPQPVHSADFVSN